MAPKFSPASHLKLVSFKELAANRHLDRDTDGIRTCASARCRRELAMNAESLLRGFNSYGDQTLDALDRSRADALQLSLRARSH